MSTATQCFLEVVFCYTLFLVDVHCYTMFFRGCFLLHSFSGGCPLLHSVTGGCSLLHSVTGGCPLLHSVSGGCPGITPSCACAQRCPQQYLIVLLQTNKQHAQPMQTIELRHSKPRSLQNSHAIIKLLVLQRRVGVIKKIICSFLAIKTVARASFA